MAAGARVGRGGGPKLYRGSGGRLCPARLPRGTGRTRPCGVRPRCGCQAGPAGLLGSQLRPRKESSGAPEGRGSSQLPPKTEVGRSPSVERPRLSPCRSGRRPLRRGLPPGRIFKNEAPWPRWSGEKKPFPARAALCNGIRLGEWLGGAWVSARGRREVPLACVDRLHPLLRDWMA
ncbi:hypothetical protein NDU88_001297 [Pleurodeles waltl]|uniref:Uncharacterized protein n=1 Tax=Pleurodeles waltl TaxID=8319 RepID=A0AAV7UUA3_PLEWA|nr:hypothetical protein NDU88_001297 [Pleurodeles waltl]